MQSISEETPEDNDLDPVALQKAFTFAARSSVVLVCVLSVTLRNPELISSCLDAPLPRRYSTPVVLRTYRIWRQRADRLGRYRDSVDLLQCLHGRDIPALREQGCYRTNISWHA